MENTKKLELDSKSFLASDPFFENLSSKDLNDYINMLTVTATYFEPNYAGGENNVQDSN